MKCKHGKNFDWTAAPSSAARIIMGEDEAALLRLWHEKRGEIEPEDLSGDLLVQLGTITEQLNRARGGAVPPRPRP